jgi:glucose-1-phosphatase
MLHPDRIKNIIFDLGGVVINLAPKLTLEKFRKLGLSNIEDYYTQFRQTGLFDNLDKGRISNDEFIERLSELFPEPPAKEAVLDAWNTMILNFPEANAELLLKLKTRYNTFLLSNTNEIHLTYYFNELKNTYGVMDMSSFVHKEYYSCRINMRKPDQEIFEHVIRDNQLNPAETLFIDDTLQHVEGARKTGLIAHHLVESDGILGLLKSFA